MIELRSRLKTPGGRRAAAKAVALRWPQSPYHRGYGSFGRLVHGFFARALGSPRILRRLLRANIPEAEWRDGFPPPAELPTGLSESAWRDRGAPLSSQLVTQLWVADGNIETLSTRF